MYAPPFIIAEHARPLVLTPPAGADLNIRPRLLLVKDLDALLFVLHHAAIAVSDTAL